MMNGGDDPRETKHEDGTDDGTMMLISDDGDAD